jgi:hypothetical protein
MLRSLAITEAAAPAVSIASAWRNLWTICSGACRLIYAETRPFASACELMESHSKPDQIEPSRSVSIPICATWLMFKASPSGKMTEMQLKRLRQ